MIAYRLRIGGRLPRRARRSLVARFLDVPARRLQRRLALADVEMTSRAWVMRAAVWPAASSGFGMIWLSLPGAAAGLACGAAAPFVALRRRLRQRAVRMAEQLPDALDAVAGALRAGLSLAQALREAAADAPSPARGALGTIVAALDVGAPFGEALEAFVDAAGIDQARGVATALAIGHRSGGDTPRVLETLAAALRDRARLDQQLKAGTAQARLSAWVVAGMPVAFLLLTGATSRAQADLLLRTPVGWTLLGIGGGLEALGLLWMRRMVRG